jgi:hypothetical protein
MGSLLAGPIISTVLTGEARHLNHKFVIAT